MKAPKELVEAAYEAGWEEDAEILDSVNEARIRKALEAVLPKVRERLLSDEALEVAVEATERLSKNGVRPIVTAAFDHAFPEES